MKAKRIITILSAVLFGVVLGVVFPKPAPAVQGQQTYTGHESFSVTLADAATLTGRYRQSAASGVILGGYFGKDALMSVLNQQNCIGVRLYLGNNVDSSLTVVVVGLDGNGNDMTSGSLLETWWPCPPFCSSANDLIR